MSASNLELILKKLPDSDLSSASYPLYSLADSLDLFSGDNANSDISEIDPKANYNISLHLKDTASENSEPPEVTIRYDVSVFVNDILIGTASADAKDSDSARCLKKDLNIEQNPSLHDLLVECYGRIQFSVTVVKKAGDDDYRSGRYFSDFIPIKWDDDTKADINAMIRYIDKYDKELPLTDLDPEAKRASANYPVRISRTGEEDLDDIWSREIETKVRIKWHKWSTDIQLAKKISSVYERNYGYFRTHPATAIKKENRVSQIERMQVVTADTLRYISMHPEYLERNDRHGIPIGDYKYIPQKTMMSQNITTVDTYENRMSLGFLRSVIQGLQADAAGLANELENLEEKEPSDALKQQIQELEDWEGMFSAAIDQINQKFIMYRNALGFEATPVRTMPRATDIFLSVRPYREIFDCMKLWFDFRDYGLDRNELYLPLTRLSNLYERYFLTLLVRYFNDRLKDFSMKSSSFFYDRPSGPRYSQKDWEEANNISNTFVFSMRNRDTLTLYYQSVIYTWDDKKDKIEKKDGPKDNGIGLHRNNLIPFDIFRKILQDEELNDGKFTPERTFQQSVKNNVRLYFYRPDFLIKFEREGSPDRYVILDTKFSTRYVVRKYEAGELFYKYILSISADSDPECLTQDPYPGKKEPDRVYIVYGQHSTDGSDNIDPKQAPESYLNQCLNTVIEVFVHMSTDYAFSPASG